MVMIQRMGFSLSFNLNYIYNLIQIIESCQEFFSSQIASDGTNLNRVNYKYFSTQPLTKK